MSYDIELLGPKCTTCGKRADGPPDHDPTYNLWAIFELALTGSRPGPGPHPGPSGISRLHGRLARETLPELERALYRLLDPAMRIEFAAEAASNGWGTHDDAIEVIKRMVRDATDYPDHTWRIT